MKTKPIIFNFLFVFFTFIAVSLPLQVAFLYEHSLTSFSEWASIAMKLSPLNWMVLTLCLINGYLCYQTNPFIKYTIPASILLVGVNNFVVGAWGVDYHFVLTWVATLVYTLFSYSFVYAHGLEAIEHPEKQWWKIPTRYQRSFPVWVEWQGKRKLLAKTFDISKSGAYIAALANSKNLLPSDLKIGEHIKVLIGTDSGELELQATLVRKEKESLGHYPAGLAVHFNNLSFAQSQKLRRLLHVAH